MSETSFLTVLSLGFLLGLRHALDADHIVAVSTVLTRSPTVRASGSIGFFWGLGHTLVLLLVGCAVLALNLTIPDTLAIAFEFGVGLMLVGLGLSVGIRLIRERWHLHAHEHDSERHLHFHSHQAGADHSHSHWLRRSMQPLLIGMAHGLAGSAALMLLILSTVTTLGQGVAYILVFGAGSILGMMLLGLVISLPLVYSLSCGRQALLAMQGLASLGSIGLGLLMIVRIGMGQSPF